MRVEFHPKASEELETSSGFYEEKIAGLGNEFLNEVERMIQVLNDTPMLGIELANPFRRAVLRRFGLWPWHITNLSQAIGRHE